MQTLVTKHGKNEICPRGIHGLVTHSEIISYSFFLKSFYL